MIKEKIVKNYYIRWVKLIICILITSTILIVLFAKIDIANMIEALRGMNYYLLLLAVLMSILSGVWGSSGQMKMILDVFGCHISYREAMFIKLGVSPIKVVLPMKLGELIKVSYLRRYHAFPFVLGVGSLVVALTFKAFALLLVMFIGGFFTAPGHINFGYRSLIFIISCVALLTILNSIWRRRTLVYRLKKIQPALYQGILALFSRYKEIGKGRLAKPFLYTICIQACEIAIFYILLRAVGVTISIHALFVYVPLIILLTNIPIALFGLGVRELVIVTFLSKYAAIEQLLGGAILISFVIHILPPILGLIFTTSFLNKMFTLSPEKETNVC